jgi:uncharacterized integral membrane protein
MELEHDAQEPESEGLSDDQPEGPGNDQPKGPEAQGSRSSETSNAPVAARPHSTRTSRVWLGSVFGLVVLIAILIFILQNLASVVIHFPAASAKMPIGVAILFGVILGGLFVFLLGLARVVQLRNNIRRSRQHG